MENKKEGEKKVKNRWRFDDPSDPIGRVCSGKNKIDVWLDGRLMEHKVRFPGEPLRSEQLLGEIRGRFFGNKYHPSYEKLHLRKIEAARNRLRYNWHTYVKRRALWSERFKLSYAQIDLLYRKGVFRKVWDVSRFVYGLALLGLWKEGRGIVVPLESLPPTEIEQLRDLSVFKTRDKQSVQ